MDDRRFDQFTRSIAGATSRRGFLGRLLGVAGATGALVALAPGDANAARRGYSGPKFPKPTPDPDPCQGLTGPCTANAQCCQGFCEQGLGSGGTCQLCDATICGDFVCTDLLWDPFNCGSCGYICGSGRSCDNGTCQAHT
ncbi:MAG: twin-arginine translocation signal domain-containing protein [Thermomicrobiales bacterium]|nr:MAG: twin-arginine translocation signal domain-containing protein [Thermomicrobiales bacterium]